MNSLLVLTCLAAFCFVATNAASVDSALLDLLQALEKRRGPPKPKPKPCGTGLDAGDTCIPETGLAGDGGKCKEITTRDGDVLLACMRPPPGPKPCGTGLVAEDTCIPETGLAGDGGRCKVITTPDGDLLACIHTCEADAVGVCCPPGKPCGDCGADGLCLPPPKPGKKRTMADQGSLLDSLKALVKKWE